MTGEYTPDWVLAGSNDSHFADRIRAAIAENIELREEAQRSLRVRDKDVGRTDIARWIMKTSVVEAVAVIMSFGHEAPCYALTEDDFIDMVRRTYRAIEQDRRERDNVRCSVCSRDKASCTAAANVYCPMRAVS